MSTFKGTPIEQVLVVFNVYFTAFYEKCDTTGQTKDIRLPVVTCYSCWENSGLWLSFLPDENEWKNFESNIA